jgi:hypothetical protein
MAAKGKIFTTADAAVDRFFTQQTQDINITHDANITKDTYVSNNNKYANVTKQSKATNKSKHYDARGKRGERFGLLMDGRLKDDIAHLSMANGSKSVNDFIITVLLDYVEKEDNQKKLRRYRELLKD